MLIIGRLYRTYEAAVVYALSLNELQWDAATVFLLITRSSRNNIRMAGGKSLSPSPQNTDSLPRQSEKQNRFLNPRIDDDWRAATPSTQTPVGEVQNYVTELIYMAMQSWPLSEEADLADLYMLYLFV